MPCVVGLEGVWIPVPGAPHERDGLRVVIIEEEFPKASNSYNNNNNKY